MKFDITAKATGKASGEIMIYGYISDYKYDESDVTAKDFDKALKDLGKIDNLLVRVNSYGGSVFVGQAIVSMIDDIRAKGVKVTSKIEGIGASMGSVIPQAADKVVMAENSMMMVHKPSAMAWGNADSLLDTVEMLDKAEETLIGLYMRRFKGTQDELRELLKGKVDGTWLTAQEALELGLCDEIDEPVEMAACAGGYRMNGIVVPKDALKGAADKIQIFENKGGENEMIINKELDAKIKALADAGKSIAIENIDGNYVVSEMLMATAETATAFLTAEDAQEILGESIETDEFVSTIRGLAKFSTRNKLEFGEIADKVACMENTITSLTAKAEKFDKMFASAVSEALKNGVRAKGDAFNSERWGKILNGFSIEEVQAQSEEWVAEAEKELNAGQGRMSRVPTAGVTSTVPDDCFKLK